MSVLGPKLPNQVQGVAEICRLFPRSADMGGMLTARWVLR